MKKSFKVSVLSFALIVSLLLLASTRTNAIDGEISMKILTGTSTCTYGTSLNLGTHAADYNAFSLTGTFTTPTTFSCTDYDGLDNRAMTLLANNDLSNGLQSISKNNVFLSVNTNIVISGSCTPGVNTTTFTSIGLSAGVIITKASSVGQICTIAASGVQLAVQVPVNQAIGTYTGTLTLTSPW